MRTRTIRTSPARRAQRRPARSTPRPPAVTVEQRVREAGGPQDTAFYPCACGHGFEAAVSTHVACPHCGTDQAW